MIADISEDPRPGYVPVHISPRFLDILAALPEYGEVELTIAGGYIDKDCRIAAQYRSIHVRGDKAGEPPKEDRCPPKPPRFLGSSSRM